MEEKNMMLCCLLLWESCTAIRTKTVWMTWYGDRFIATLSEPINIITAIYTYMIEHFKYGLAEKKKKEKRSMPLNKMRTWFLNSMRENQIIIVMTISNKTRLSYPKLEKSVIGLNGSITIITGIINSQTFTWMSKMWFWLKHFNFLW